MRLLALSVLIAATTLTPIVHADDRLAVTVAAFGAESYGDCQEVIDGYRAEGFGGISFVPTYYHERLDEFSDEHTPAMATIRDCIDHALGHGMRVIYKPHIDPVAYLWGYDVFASENASWRVQLSWRGFFDFDPVASAYDEVVIQPFLAAMKELRDQRSGKPLAVPVRLELAAELMNSTIRHGEGWIALARQSREFIRAHALEEDVVLSHNFSHHIQLEEDFVLRMKSTEREFLGRYLDLLDEVSVSQYMDLTVGSSPEAPAEERVAAIAQALQDYQQRFRDLILEHHLGVARAQTMVVHIGEFGVGVGGLKHPNYWQGRPVDKDEQTLGVQGLMELLRRIPDVPKESGLTATLWTVGPAYDIFGIDESDGANPAAVEALRAYLQP